MGVGLRFVVGETADIKDMNPPLLIDCSVSARGYEYDLVDININKGDVCIGIRSDGVCNYDSTDNSGIGSNGFTSLLGLDLSDRLKTLILHPTRTYYPFIKRLLGRAAPSALIHVTGGGHKKACRFTENQPLFNCLLPQGEVWDGLTEHGVNLDGFNMGYRLQVFIDADDFNEVMLVANELGLTAEVIGCGLIEK